MPAPVRIYADHNATAPLHPAARAAMVAALDAIGNPSSIHAEGREARRLVEDARAGIAGALGIDRKRVGFAGGATEAAATLLSPGFARGPARAARLVVTGADHAAVRAGGRFTDGAVRVCALYRDGQVDLDHLRRLLLDGPGPALVVMPVADGETGIIQPVAAVREIVRATGGLLVLDATQALGRLAHETWTGADAWFASVHKIGGPKGVGLIVTADDAIAVEPLLRGGGQERGQRSGTEPVAAIAGAGAVIASALPQVAAEASRLSHARDRIEAALRALLPDVRILGAGGPRLPNTLAVAVPGLKAETALIALDLAGLAISSGSACSSGKVRKSSVLAAMGLAPDLLQGALRFSLGWSTREEDVNRIIAICEQVFPAMRARRRAVA